MADPVLIEIKNLPATFAPNPLHEFAAEKDGLTVKLRLDQIPTALLFGPLAYAATDDASHVDFTDGAGPLVATNVQAAIIEALALAATPGQVAYFAQKAAPTGWLKNNGAAVSRTTFANLKASIAPVIGTAVLILGNVTWTIASHGLELDDRVSFTTTGTLPVGFAVGVNYWVLAAGLNATQFQLSATQGGAAIVGITSQSGVHTAHLTPFGVGDGTTTFNVPEDRGEFRRALDDGRAIDVGRKIGTAQAADNAPHTHTGTTSTEPTHKHNTILTVLSTGSNITGVVRTTTGSSATGVNADTDFVGSHNHTFTSASQGAEGRPRNMAYLSCIRY